MTAAMPRAESVLEPAPSAIRLFLAFARIGLTSFGGGLSGWLLRDFVQRRRWISEEDFLNGLAVSQALPGINVTNMAIWIGYRLRGPFGALVGLAGIVVPSSVVIVILGIGLARISGLGVVQTLLAGAAATAVGMPLYLGIASARAVRRDAMPIGVLIATFAAVGLLRLPLLAVVVTAGAVSVAWEYRRLRRKAS